MELRWFDRGLGVACGIAAVLLLGRVFVVENPVSATTLPPLHNKDAISSDLFELVNSQLHPWGSFSVYRCKDTLNGFLVTLDLSGNVIAMNPLVNTNGEPQRYDDKGGIIPTRLMNELRGVSKYDEHKHIYELKVSLHNDTIGPITGTITGEVTVPEYRSDYHEWEFLGGLTNGSDAHQPFRGSWRGHPNIP